VPAQNRANSRVNVKRGTLMHSADAVKLDINAKNFQKVIKCLCFHYLLKIAYTYSDRMCIYYRLQMF